MTDAVLRDKGAEPTEDNKGPPADEVKLIAKAKHGDTEAFGELVQRYQRRVYKVIYRFVKNHHQTDDLAQETFIRAFKAIDRFDLRYPFSPWIYRIAINLTINYVKKRKLKMVDTEVDLKTSGKNPVNTLEKDETRKKVHQAIASLPLKLRQVLVLRVYEDWSYNRIAEVLELPIGTVMSRLSRAREALKEKLGSLL